MKKTEDEGELPIIESLKALMKLRALSQCLHALSVLQWFKRHASNCFRTISARGLSISSKILSAA